MVKFNGALYSYVHNLQGDIVGIVDNAGSLAVEYKYDAWGKPTLVRTLTAAYEALAELNPFRYRGYVYEAETELYYLWNRYYSADFARFLNTDIVILETLVGKNLYAYCYNGPILLGDTQGSNPSIYILNPLFHKQVQIDICKNSNGLIDMEMPVSEMYTEGGRYSSNGRVDLVNISSGEIWEVKKATIPYEVAERQVRRYQTGKLECFVGYTELGGYIKGKTSFLNYNIFYYSTGPGVIAYEVYDGDTGDLVPIPSPRAEKALEDNRARRKEYSTQKAPSFAIDMSDIGKACLALFIIGVSYYLGPAIGNEFGRLVYA